MVVAIGTVVARSVGVEVVAEVVVVWTCCSVVVGGLGAKINIDKMCNYNQVLQQL